MISMLWLHTEHSLLGGSQSPSHLATDVSSIQVPREEEKQEGCLALHTDVTKGKSQAKRERLCKACLHPGPAGSSPECPASTDVHCQAGDNFTRICPSPQNFSLELQQVLNPSVHDQAKHFLWKLQNKSFPKNRILKTSLNSINLNNKKEPEKTTFEVKKS